MSVSGVFLHALKAWEKYVEVLKDSSISLGHLIFALLLIWRKNPTYVMPFGSLMKCLYRIFKIPLFSSSSVFLMVLNPPSGVEN